MDTIVVNGDVVLFDTAFGDATVTSAPTTITGSSSVADVNGSALCLSGDEGNVTAVGAYMTSTYTTPGAGTLAITALGDDQLTEVLTVEGKAVILVGSQFEAEFTVTVPAQQISGTSTVLDSNTSYGDGTGSFTSVNAVAEAE